MPDSVMRKLAGATGNPMTLLMIAGGWLLLSAGFAWGWGRFVRRAAEDDVCLREEIAAIEVELDEPSPTQAAMLVGMSSKTLYDRVERPQPKELAVNSR